MNFGLLRYSSLFTGVPKRDRSKGGGSLARWMNMCAQRFKPGFSLLFHVGEF